MKIILHVCPFHTAKEATDPGFVEKLVTQIVKNVQVATRTCVLIVYALYMHVSKVETPYNYTCTCTCA